MLDMGYRALQTAHISLIRSDGSPLEFDTVEGEDIDVEGFEQLHGTHLVQIGIAEWDGVVPEGAYDPAEHKVDEVNAYLDAHPEEVDAVLAAEAAGRNRAGIVVTGRHVSPDDDPSTDPDPEA